MYELGAIRDSSFCSPVLSDLGMCHVKKEKQTIKAYKDTFIY